MNKIIEASDTLTAGLKIALAGVVVYGLYRGYVFSQDIKQKTDEISQDIDSAKVAASDFVTETINPTSENNFINQSFVGDILGPPVDAVIRFLEINYALENH